MASLLTRYARKLVGVLSCFDRIVITGTIPGWCHADGMARSLTGQGIRLFDYAQQFAEPLRDEIRANAERLAAEHGLTIEFIRKVGAFRKEDRSQEILAERGEQPGLVQIFAAMETCPAFTPLDHTSVHIADLARAQTLADTFPVEQLHRVLDAVARRFCPAITRVPDGYHGSLMPVEYATDLILKRREDVQPLYDELVRLAIHLVKPEHVAMFLGKKLDGRTVADLGTEFRTRTQGTCLKHHLGWAAIKMYDQHGIVLRIETTVNHVTELQHYRTVEHRDGTSEQKFAPMHKTISSLPPLRELLGAANQRYLAFLSDLDDPSEGQRHITELGPSRHKNGRSFRGFNLFQRTDLDALVAILDGKGCISGMTNRLLRRILTDKSSAQISYFLKRCRVLGLLKKCGKTDKYYRTKLGRRVLLAARKVQECVIVPTLAGKECA